MDLQFLQIRLPSSKPTPSGPHIQGETVENLRVHIEPTSTASAQTVSNEEVPTITEGWGGRKRRVKHPTRLYECDCREIISHGELEQGEGVIECNKSGCEMRWVSGFSSLKSKPLLTILVIVPYEMCPS